MKDTLRIHSYSFSNRERVAQLGKVGDFNADDPISKPTFRLLF